MNENLYLPRWNTLTKDNKLDEISKVIKNIDIEFIIRGVETFSQNNMTVETVLLEYEKSEFVFVPGGLNITLGWDKEKCKIGEGLISDLRKNREEIIDYYRILIEDEKEYYETEIENARKLGDYKKVESLIKELKTYLEDYKYEKISHGGESFDNYIELITDEFDKLTSPIRVVNIDPMIVERDVNSANKFLKYESLISELSEGIFQLPTEDEWEYLCGGGTRSLYRWGDSIMNELNFIYSIGTAKEDNSILYKPNMFGLHILYNSYRYELVDGECFYKGADGGGSLCGGDGTMGVAPVYTTFYRPIIGEIGWHINKNFCTYRRIISLGKYL